MIKIFFIIGMAVFPHVGQAQIRDFQTTRLQSTAGAGVASVLATEAAILNPATAAFFEGSSSSIHLNTTTLRATNAQRSILNDPYPSANKSRGFFVADHSGPIKGGTSYLQQNENNYQRERFILHGAIPVGPATAVGISYRYTQDKLPPSFSKRHDTFHQISLGSAHIIDEKTVVGLLMVDPTRSRPGEERLTGGFQYNISDKFLLIGDAGFQFTRTLNRHYHWNAALQLNIFSDFFFRLGQFHDQIRQFKGTGWGVSWIGPRMGLEFAQRYSEQVTDRGYIYAGESLVDTSLSVIIKF